MVELMISFTFPLQFAHMKKVPALIIACCVFIVNIQAQPSFIKDSLDNYINEGLKDWNIPGLAIAIVKDGKVVVAKGYGVRSIKTKDSVNENTLFLIASNTKLFTGTALAQLDVDKKLSLDDKVTQYLKMYKLYDNDATELLTIKDLMGHHIGTKTFQGDFTFWNSKLSRLEIMSRMSLLKPSLLFRAEFGYCNSCFLTAGEVIPIVTKKPWEVYVYDSIITPLDLKRTYTLSNVIAIDKNAATPYTTAFGGQLTQLPYDQLFSLAPAAGMVSCVNDLAKWLILQLDSGRYDGKQIVEWNALKKTREINTVISGKRNDTHTSPFEGYGLGIFVTDDSGKVIYWHTGGADGFVSNTCFVPDEKLGIVILTNNDNQDFFELLRHQVLNAYLNEPYKNLSKERLPSFLKEQDEKNKKITAWNARLKTAKQPPLKLYDYEGTYKNDLYGAITLASQDDNSLTIKFKNHPSLKATLRYMDHDEWLLTYNNMAYGIFSTHFKIQKRKIVSFDLKVSDFIEYDPYTFTKEE